VKSPVKLMPDNKDFPANIRHLIKILLPIDGEHWFALARLLG
jgi:hypothetical protein